MYKRQKRAKDAPVRKPPEETIRYLKDGELKRLMETAKARSKRDFAIFLLAVRHGLRSSEVCGLKVSSIDLDAKLIETGRLKGSVKCCQKMQPDEMRAVTAWLKERATRYPYTDALFPSERTGKAMTRSGLLQLMEKYGALIGLQPGKGGKCQFHILKHTCATQMLQNKAPIAWIQEWLGHKDIRNTSIYAQLTPKGFDEESERIFARLPTY